MGGHVMPACLNCSLTRSRTSDSGQPAQAYRAVPAAEPRPRDRALHRAATETRRTGAA